LLFPFNTAFSDEKQQTPILQFVVWLDRDSNTRSTAIDMHLYNTDNDYKSYAQS
jgi:hypothetical protein